MSFVNVVIVGPNGQEWDAELEEGATEESIKASLIRRLDLSSTSESGSKIDYMVSFDTLGIREGTRITVTRIGRDPFGNLKPRS